MSPTPLIASLGTALKATYQRFSPKPLPASPGAFRWTTNQRRALHAMIPALCAAAAAAQPTRKTAYARTGQLADKRIYPG